ncbi:hypothetical protein [Actinomadura sp. 21ATH]|uniref:hypothetical protein n=1 Tax=Actinomadura sp. 21ATH TaxID=1735444 RepID=UPI0035BF6294
MPDANMPDANGPTNGELYRNVKELKQDLRERDAAKDKRIDTLSSDLSQRMDRKVSTELFNAHLESDKREKDELREEDSDLREQLRRWQERSAADRRLAVIALFTAVAAPLLTSYLRSKGAAP